MGWLQTSFPVGQSVRDFFAERLSSQNHRFIDGAFVNFSEFYAAIEIDDGRKKEVVAVIAKVAMTRGSYRSTMISWKMMDETMGPVIDNCPKRILDLLSPADSQNAIEWRRRCLDKIFMRQSMPSVSVNSEIVFDHPISFTDGSQIDRFMIDSVKGPRIMSGRYRLTRKLIESHYLQGECSIDGVRYQPPRSPSASPGI